MDLGDDELTRLAELARIDLPSSERETLKRDLAALLGAFRQVRDADDDPDRVPLLRPGDPTGGLRDDVVVPGLPHERVVAASHGSVDGRIRVPRTAADDG